MYTAYFFVQISLFLQKKVKFHIVLGKSEKKISTRIMNWGPLPPFSNAGIQYAIVYTDIVCSSYFGEKKVDILDVVSMGSDGNTGFHTTSYQKLKRATLEEISIKITDQIGRPVYFPPTTAVICSLHFRRIYKY